MFKLLKYEHRGSRKFMTILIAVFVVAMFFTMLMTRNTLNVEDYRTTNFNVAVSILGTVIITGTIITFLFYMLSLLRRDLNQDTAYLTFSLPLNGFQIIGAKLMNIVIWAIIFLICATAFSILFASIIFEGFWESFLEGMKNLVMHVHVKNIVVYAISSIISLFNIYLSFALAMIIGKAIFKNGKMSWLWILIFFLIQYLNVRLSTLFVYNSGSLTEFIFGGPHTLYYPNTPEEAYAIMLRGLGFNFVIGAIMFLLSSILWEKSVEI